MADSDVPVLCFVAADVLGLSRSGRRECNIGSNGSVVLRVGHPSRCTTFRAEATAVLNRAAASEYKIAWFGLAQVSSFDGWSSHDEACIKIATNVSPPPGGKKSRYYPLVQAFIADVLSLPRPLLRRSKRQRCS